MKKLSLYLLLALFALPFAACTNDESGVEGEVTEREFMTMFRKDHNTNKGDSEPYACGVKNINDIQLYWYGVHGCAGYQIRVGLLPNVSGGEQAWEESAAAGRLVLDTIVGPEVLDLLVKDLEYATSYRFAIRTLSHKGEGYHSKWYGYGDGRHWADWCGYDTGERYLTPLMLNVSKITKTSFRVNFDRVYATAGDDANGTMKENFEVDADGNFVFHYLTITPSPTNATAAIDPKWSKYYVSAEELAQGYVDVEGLDENSVYVIKAVNENVPVFVDAVYNTVTPRTDGTPGDPVELKWDELYIQNDSVPGANDRQAARLDEWLVNYTADATMAEGSIFYLDGGKSYYFHQSPTLCKGFTLATNPADIQAGKDKAKVFLGGTAVVGNAPNSCNFMFGRQPQTGEGDAEINVKSVIFENIHFDCPTAKNFGDGSATGNYFANMYSNGMGVVFSSFEARNCIFERMVRGFIRVQGAKRKVFENIIVENCIFVNCGYYDNNGQGYCWIDSDGKTPKSNVFTNTVFRGNVFYDSPRRAIFRDNNANLAWPENVHYHITMENNTILNFSTRSSGRYMFDLRQVPSGSTFTVKNNLFIMAKKDGDARNMNMAGMDIRTVNGSKQEITFDISGNYCTTTDTSKQKDDGIFNNGAFSAKKNSAGSFLSYLPGVVSGETNLVTKHTVAADGSILSPTQIFVDPCPPHTTTSATGSEQPEMHERDLEDMLRGMKFQSNAAVTGAEFYQKKVGSPLLY
ncbi:MAG: hypothetical protein IKU77_05545 [Alistipes sp.]|nr:hypothetical protein [Alistipes sp.]